MGSEILNCLFIYNLAWIETSEDLGSEDFVEPSFRW